MAKEIVFSDRITPKTLPELIKAISEKDRNILYMNCPGGDTDSAIAFCSYVRTKNILLDVVVLNLCSSSALALLCAGEMNQEARGNQRSKRIGFKESVFLMHPIRINYEEGISLTSDDLKRKLQELQLTEKHFWGIIAEATGKSTEELEGIYKKEMSLNAQEALELGLLTEIR